MREGLSVSVCRHWHQTLCKPIICLWHCGMRHRGGSTVFCERVRVKLPRSTRPMIHYSNRAHRRSLVVGSLKIYCRKVLHICYSLLYLFHILFIFPAISLTEPEWFEYFNILSIPQYLLLEIEGGTKRSTLSIHRRLSSSNVIFRAL